MKYFDIFIDGYKGYANYLWNDFMNPSWSSYTYWFLLVSLVFFILEVIMPWRKNQKVLRKDFWLDLFYMFFNIFLFSLIIYNALSSVVVEFFNETIKSITSGFDLQANNPLTTFPRWSILIIGFLLRDFVQWWIHRLLHRNETLWQFHKIHHSVKEMGFAAHLRYHWMENIVYRTLEYIPLALLGIGLHDFFVIHVFTLAWGHYNHANIRVNKYIVGGIVGCLIGVILSQGLLDLSVFYFESWIAQVGVLLGSILIGVIGLSHYVAYIFNSPEMHIWHHAHDLPSSRKYGVNFGLTLAIWDYIFKTNYIPEDGRNIELGFPGDTDIPDDFLSQSTYGIL